MRFIPVIPLIPVIPRKPVRTATLIAAVILGLAGCQKEAAIPENEPPAPAPGEPAEDPYPGVPRSDIYEITITGNGEAQELAVFKNACPEFEAGKDGMIDNDRFPLEIFAGRSINWARFSLEGSVTVEVRVLDRGKVPVSGTVRVLPSRHGISPAVEGNVIRFTLSKPGQFSIEIGENGYKNGLVLFADPPETGKPSAGQEGFALLEAATPADLVNLPAEATGIYFSKGVHDIGVYRVPAHIKRLYFEEGSWVYGALIMDGNPGVKIYGRGVLSSARLKYRQSHCIEAINQSNNIHIEGIVVADPKYFAIRLIGQHNVVKWTKVIGGWVYNCDGIAAYKGSTVSNCFIWANDDAIKVYRDDITWTDCVVWQLNNGGIIQMSWGGSNATNVRISRLDVLRAEWNKPGFNRALLSCVGNRYQLPDRNGLQRNWLIEDVVTETAVPVVFNITPDPSSPNHIEGLVLKNWDVKMKMGTNYRNMIIGNDPERPLEGWVFDNFRFNGIKLTTGNWQDVTELQTENLLPPEFR